ncbi:MAG: xanthine dehydrogenase family protein subunit M [Clostridia bacterium]|nr:xanthine dehydrogenase family protein subunit M [Clostridia bacterium]
MKPSKFRYTAPSMVAEALDFLNEYGSDAKILAGGQSLVPMLNLRLARPKILVDINRVEELSFIRVEGDTLVIGALTRHAELEKSEIVKQNCPLLSEAAALIGSRAVRTRGTIGGSLAHCDPAAELPCVLHALGAEALVVSKQGERTISMDEFFITYFTTALRPDELIREIRVPVFTKRMGHAITEVWRRYGDFALVNVAAWIKTDSDEKVVGAGIALGGVGGSPHKAKAADLLVGKRPDEKAIKETAEAVADEISPESDNIASSDYRRHLAKVLTRRALTLAAARIRG